MPIPLFLGVAAAIAGVAGVGTGIHGGIKMKEANDTMELADKTHKKNIKRFEESSKKTSKQMDKVGLKELEILKSFEMFSKLFEKIHNKPEFNTIGDTGVKLPSYNAEEIKKASVGAGVLLGGIGGAALGTVGGVAAAGATTAAVMALGTASTGTAITALSGAAATNATLAVLGGGTLAAGGGGMALGTAILGGATLGVGLLVGGVIFSITGSSLSDKADEAWKQMKKAEEEINKICEYLGELFISAEQFYNSLIGVNDVYINHYNSLYNIVEKQGKTDWNMFTQDEKLTTQNIVKLVALLFSMCTLQLVLVSEDENESNDVNYEGINKSIEDADKVLAEL